MYKRSLLAAFAAAVMAFTTVSSASAAGSFYACLKDGNLNKVGLKRPKCVGGAKVVSWNIGGESSSQGSKSDTAPSVPVEFAYGIPDFPVALLETESQEYVAIAVTPDLVPGATYLLNASTNLDVYVASSSGMTEARCEVRAPDQPLTVQRSSLQGWGTPESPLRGTISITRIYTVPPSGSLKMGLFCNAYLTTQTQARNTIITATPLTSPTLNVTVVRRPNPK